MLLRLPIQEAIRDGRVDLVFRRWRRPTVKTGGRLRCAVGELAIVSVEEIDPSAVDDAQAVRAGFGSRDELIHDLFRERSSGVPNAGDGVSKGRSRMARVDDTSALFRVQVAFAGVDTRAALRETLLVGDELDSMIARLAKIDLRSTRGPWTAQSLQLIGTWPGRRAPELAEIAGCETLPWKAEIRRLKELGLTESLTVGYRLSPRGEQVVNALESGE